MHVARRVRGQKHRRRADILGLAPAPGGTPVEERPAAPEIETQGRGAVGLDTAGRDGVHVDPARGQFTGRQPRLPGNAMPGRGVGRNPDAALKVRDTDAATEAMRVHLARIAEILDQSRLQNRDLFVDEG